MKATIAATLNTSYDDGAGKTCTYSYPLASQVVAYLAKSSWRLRAFRLASPLNAVTITANVRGSVVSTPPAANTRTAAISTTGVVTLVDANEAISHLAFVVTLSEVEEGAYESMVGMVIDDSSSVLSSGTFTKFDEYVAVTFCADADYIAQDYIQSNTFATAKKLPSAAIIVAETDLVTREYTGMYGEIAAKGLASVLQLASGAYEGVAAQVVTYLQSGNSPMALELTMTVHQVRVGA